MSISKYNRDVSAIKQKHKKILLKAQRKFRRELKKGSTSIEFQEVMRTGGQFSFKRKSITQINAELIRINKYLNSHLTSEQEFIHSAYERSAPYIEMFSRGLKDYERIELGLPEEGMSDLYRVYRKLEEEDPAAIMYGGLFDSDSFIAYLYSYAIEGHSMEQVQNYGHELIQTIRAADRKFDTRFDINPDVPKEWGWKR